MPHPIKLFKKVPIVVISHLILIIAVVSLIAFPELPYSVQLVIINLTKTLIDLAIWAHRLESIYQYDRNNDNILQTKLRHQQRNKQNN